MKELTVDDVIKVCDGKLICGNPNIILGDFCKDTRIIKEGEVFVGIKGENYNGSEYYEEALKKGAKVCILDKIVIDEVILPKYPDRAIIIVDDTIMALQKLAMYKRNMYNIPVVAVTGSVGKTSTKDIIASVMAKKFNRFVL